MDRQTEKGSTGNVMNQTTEKSDSMVPDDYARRRFMQMIGVGAGAVALGGPMSLVHASNGGGSNIGFWNKVENSFVLDSRKLFMNIGTAGSMPREVLQFFDEANKEYAKNSLSGYGNFAALRERIAPGFGVDPDELVVSYNTSDGMCHAILGIPWEAGDCVVTTNHEHPGGNVPLQIAVDRYGIVVRRVLLPTGNGQTPEQYQELFQDAIDQARADGLNVRAMMWSSPTFLTGTMLPIRHLVDVAIANGLVSICDGAHLPGMMNYNYAELGVDFMSGAGHKWQCGPGSTGILVIRNKVRSEYNPLPLTPYFPVTTSSYSPSIGGVAWSDRATGPVETFNIANVIQSCGSKHSPMLNSLGVACDMWDEIGRQTIQDYILGLSAYLKSRIIEELGEDALYSPDNPELLSALTSFNPFIDKSQITNSAMSGQFVQRLNEEYGIVIRNTGTPVLNSSGGLTTVYPLRVSTHLWHDRRDVDRLMDSVMDLARKIDQGN